MKRIAALTAALMLAFVLAGCAQSEPTEEAAIDQQDQQKPAEKIENKTEALVTEDFLNEVSYTVPAGWVAKTSSDELKSYTKADSSIVINSYGAPASLEGETDEMIQLALLSSLKSWEDTALDGLTAAEKLVEVNGLKIQAASLDIRQDGVSARVNLATFVKGSTVYVAILSSPDTVAEENDKVEWWALIDSCK